MTQAYFVYKLTCTVNGKIYIGASKNPINRLKQHRSAARNGVKQLLYSAMRKHGVDSFKLEVLYGSQDRNYIFNEMEPYFVRLFESQIKGYNMTPGGDDPPQTESSRKKRSIAIKTLYENPIWKSSHIIATTKANQNLEKRKQDTEAATTRWADPAFKTKMKNLYQTSEQKEIRTHASIGKAAIDWELTEISTGIVTIVHNLAPWAKERGFNPDLLRRVASGKLKQVYGYRCKNLKRQAKGLSEKEQEQRKKIALDWYYRNREKVAQKRREKLFNTQSL